VLTLHAKLQQLGYNLLAKSVQVFAAATVSYA